MHFQFGVIYVMGRILRSVLHCISVTGDWSSTFLRVTGGCHDCASPYRITRKMIGDDTVLVSVVSGVSVVTAVVG